MSLAKKIAGLGLDALGTAVGGPFGALAANWIGGKLGLSEDDAQDPAKIAAAIDADPEAAKVKLAEIEKEKAQFLAVMSARETRITETQQTMRAEENNDDQYVRRWRPTWGYVTCAAWFIEALAIAAAIGGATWAALHGHATSATALFNGATALTYALAGQWSIALTVLGVSIAQRSKDKQVAAGQTPPPSLLGALAQRLMPKQDTSNPGAKP